MTTSKLTRSAVMKLTPSDAREAVLMLYLERNNQMGYAADITTEDVAERLGCSAATVRNLLTPMQPVWKSDPNSAMRRSMPIEGIDMKRGGSAGYGRGAYPDTWAPSVSLLRERLAAAMATASWVSNREPAPAVFPMSDEPAPF